MRAVSTADSNVHKEMEGRGPFTGLIWYIVPADNKWFTRIVVAAAVIEALTRSTCTIRRSARRS
jgi:polyphosphate kinase 2 (PPK2 family)